MNDHSSPHTLRIVSSACVFSSAPISVLSNWSFFKVHAPWRPPIRYFLCASGTLPIFTFFFFSGFFFSPCDWFWTVALSSSLWCFPLGLIHCWSHPIKFLFWILHFSSLEVSFCSFLKIFYLSPHYVWVFFISLSIWNMFIEHVSMSLFTNFIFSVISGSLSTTWCFS